LSHTRRSPAGLPGVRGHSAGRSGDRDARGRGCDRGDRGLIWGFSALVLGLVGLIGLMFWLAGLPVSGA
jgi:hypothetical protein